jgi:hypothetical protein
MNDIPINREMVMTDSAPDNRTVLLVEMSHDLGIQAEIAAINREFAVAEMDGLRSDLKCLRIDD